MAVHEQSELALRAPRFHRRQSGHQSMEVIMLLLEERDNGMEAQEKYGAEEREYRRKSKRS
jgi:hypothetical protein